MKANPFWRVLAWLLPFILAVFAATGMAQNGPSREVQAARLAKAEAMFQERCKTAGEKIHRTVPNVVGLFLMTLRPSDINYGDQYRMDDPYGRDLGGDGYIETFVRGSFQANNSVGTGAPSPDVPAYLGYLYVEAIDPKDGKRYRYTGRIEEPWQYNKSYLQGYKRFVLDKAAAKGKSPRYGVTYDDISTREERDYWIAGSSLKVIDLKTNEVIAERIGYMMDRGQGNTSGGRAPWLLAPDNACPMFAPRHGATAQRRQTQKFVEKVLNPKLEK